MRFYQLPLTCPKCRADLVDHDHDPVMLDGKFPFTATRWLLYIVPSKRMAAYAECPECKHRLQGPIT